MYALKLIGCICIIAAASGYGYSRGLEYKKRVEVLEELERIMWEIQGEIAYTKAPFTEVCLRVHKRVKNPYQKWLFVMARQMEDKGNSVFGKIWEGAVNEQLGGLALAKDDKEELIEMGGRIGYLDIRMQEETFLHYGKRVEEKRKKLQKELAEKRRLCGCLGVMGGIVLSLLLI